MEGSPPSMAAMAKREEGETPDCPDDSEDTVWDFPIDIEGHEAHSDLTLSPHISVLGAPSITLTFISTNQEACAHNKDKVIIVDHKKGIGHRDVDIVAIPVRVYVILNLNPALVASKPGMTSNHSLAIVAQAAIELGGPSICVDDIKWASQVPTGANLIQWLVDQCALPVDSDGLTTDPFNIGVAMRSIALEYKELQLKHAHYLDNNTRLLEAENAALSSCLKWTNESKQSISTSMVESSTHLLASLARLHSSLVKNYTSHLADNIPLPPSEDLVKTSILQDLDELLHNKKLQESAYAFELWQVYELLGREDSLPLQPNNDLPK
ncbi:hypothetical protein H0H87_002431 [Tephrocybe sp. NHM501043]|nr:hypothetical protein H0H87_002431 [Tephrocybe sp. NHM501043]